MSIAPQTPGAVTDPTLFGDDAAVVQAEEPAEKLSAGRRLTIRQRRLVDAGIHPLTHRRHAGLDAPEKCGNCRFRRVLSHRAHDFPKCLYGDGARITHGAATDVRAWWPACTDHEWGDATVSPDAARSGPDGEAA